MMKPFHNLKVNNKSNSSDKYNIAWFKLAEFISRGEKERAMGIYKLLTLSINDPALALQLEGDILFYFDDSNAINKYLHAATLYHKEMKIIQAISIYEHLIILIPEKEEYLKTSYELYKELNFSPKTEFAAKRLIEFYLRQNNQLGLLLLLKDVEINLELETTLHFYYDIISFFVNEKDYETNFSFVLKSAKNISNNNLLLMLLDKLEVLNKRLHSEILYNLKK